MDRQREWLWASFFLLGAFSVAWQAMLLREFFVIASGNELSFGICLGNWLLGVFLGSLLGGRRADATADPRRLYARAAALMAGAAPLLLGLVRLSHTIAGTPLGMSLSLESVWLASALTAMPFSALLGFLFPLAARLSLESEPPEGREGRAVSGFYALEALGSLAGGAAYTFLLAGRVSTLVSAFALSLLLSLCFWMLSLSCKKRGASSLHGLISLLLLAVLLTGLAASLDQWTARQRWQSISREEWVEGRDTPYQNLQLGRREGQYSLYGNGQLTVSFPDPETQRLTAMHLLIQHPKPRRLLVIGDVLSGLAQGLLAAPIDELTAYTLDPELLRMVERHLEPGAHGLLSDPRLHLKAEDGRRALGRLAGSTAGRPYDLLFVNEPEPATALSNRFYTADFFAAASRALSREGVLCLRLLPSETFSGGDIDAYNASLFQTARSVFPFATLTPGPIPLLFASRVQGSISSDPALLAERFAALGIEPKGWVRLLPFLYPEERIRSQAAAALGFPDLRNLDRRPVSYYLFGRIFGWYSGSRLSPLLHRLEGVRPFSLLWLLVLPLAGLLATMAKRKGRSRASPLPLALALAGFSCLSLEMLLLYWFQNRMGYAYGSIGLIVALFMLGVASGAAVARSVISRARRVLFASLLLVAATAGLLPPLMSLRTVPATLIFLLTAASGALLGAIFAAALHLRVRAGTHAGREAGILNAADHLGSSLGALLSCSLLLPLFGTVPLSALIAGLALLAILVVALEPLPGKKGG